MYLGMDGKYSAFEELMHYYHLNFYVYYFLLLIVFVNCIKVIVNFTSVKKKKRYQILPQVIWTYL